ncbi:MAG: tetraacyldisaccharide 4'-kinase [Mariprofundus sp.]|nr:tetraacyldisaccharide 4'-kinase [Mariprofundus sp.]
MFKLHHWFEQMWWRPSPPPLWLRTVEALYSGISQIHLNRRAANITTPALPMISVGNITAGGSAKTPFVLWLSEQLKAQGYKPVILCRGDGGQNRSGKCVSSDDQAACVGDEAKMLADLSSCPVISAADRITASQMAAELGDILILDDGFQYRHMQRCCDIVLIPVEGIGNGHGIPAGPLREPVQSLARADVIIRTGSTSNKQLCKKLGDWHEWQWLTAPLDIIDLMKTDIPSPKHVYAVTAIARPERFFNDLKSTGLMLSGTKSYPDHHAYSTNDVSDILSLGPHIAITAKDAVKLQDLWPIERPLWLLPQQGHAETELLSTIQHYLPQRKNPAESDRVS